jgi:ABC-type branched-subunit amino acid transport system substrate-binding protein
MAARTVFEETHRSYLVLGDRDPELTATGSLAMGTQTTFRLSWNQGAQGKETATGAYTDLGLRRTLVAHDGTTDAEAVAKEYATAFRAQRKDRQGEVPDVVSVSSPTDAEALAKRVPSIEPDLVFYAGNGRLAAALQQALTAQKYAGKFLVNDTARTDDAFTRLGAARDGTYAVEAALPKGTGYDTWKEAFEKGNGAPGPLAAEANDALLVVLQALDAGTQSKADKFEIGRRILSQIVRGFPVDGVTGKLGFDAKGERTASMVSLVKFTEGAYVAVPKVTPTPAVSLTPSADTQAAMATAIATAFPGFAGTPVAEGTSGTSAPAPAATPAAGAPPAAGPQAPAPTPGS